MVEAVEMPNRDAIAYVLPLHYSGRRPPARFSYGFFCDGAIVGAVIFGTPASPYLCKGVAGEENRKNVIELSRVVNTSEKPTSYLVAKALRKLKKQGDFIVVSYADAAMGHVGTIYQATNWLYTGATKSRTDMGAGDGKHSRHHKGAEAPRVYRSSKHRYVTFIGSKGRRAAFRRALKYPVLPYPDGTSSRYKLGIFIKTKYVE